MLKFNFKIIIILQLNSCHIIVSHLKRDQPTVVPLPEIWNLKEISSQRKSDLKMHIEVKPKTEGFLMRSPFSKSKPGKSMNLKLAVML